VGEGAYTLVTAEVSPNISVFTLEDAREAVAETGTGIGTDTHTDADADADADSDSDADTRAETAGARVIAG